MTKISVIVPTYNRATELQRCLKSLVSQTYKNFEVIVSDDGSTDNTKDVVQQFTDKLEIKYIYSENFGGPAKPRNLAIKAASGHFIAFLDADDSWAADKLFECYKHLSKDSDLVYHRFYMSGSLIARKFGLVMPTRKLKKPVFNDLLFNGNCIMNSSVIVKKQVIEAVGEIDESRDVIAAEDFDYWLRISMVTDSFTFIDLPLGSYQQSSDTVRSPVKVLKNLNYLKVKYKSYLEEKEPLWMTYMYCRVYFKLRNRHLFSFYRAKSLAFKPGTLIQLKLLIMQVQMMVVRK